MNMNKYVKWGCGVMAVLIGIAILLFALLMYICFSADVDDGPSYEDRSEVFNSAKKIEKLTNIQLPEFDVLKFKTGPMDFFGDHDDTLVVHFRDVNTDSISRLLDQYNTLQKNPKEKRYEFFSKNNDYGVYIVLNENGNNGEIIYVTW